MEKKRDIQLDNFKGLLILFVVIGHFLYDLSDKGIILTEVLKIIYLFHMPAFAFISGYFSKGEFTAKKCFKIGLFYILMNIVLMFFSFCFKGKELSLITPYYSAWYLLALIVWRLSVKPLGKIKGIIPISIVVALLIGFWTEINNVFALSRIIGFFPFFIIGYKISNKIVDKLFKKKKISTIIIGILILSVLITVSAVFVRFAEIEELTMDPYKTYGNLLNRVIIVVLASSFIYSLLLLIPNRKIVGITRFGEKSLYIYFYHRIIVLLLMLLYRDMNIALTLLCFLLLSVAICFIFSSKKIIDFTELLINYKEMKFGKTIMKIEAIAIIAILLLIPCFSFNNKHVSNNNLIKNENDFKIYNILSDDEKEKIENSFSILYAGDLILLKEQVKRGYNVETKTYDFSEMFEYTNKYISSADLSIGVFEGPMASEKEGFSNSDFDDGIEMYLNFPDEFGQAVKKSGFDLVTLANNHMLDKGEEGLNRTIDVLDKLGLEHTGGYKNENERNNVQIIEKEGLKFGILSYTYGCNYYQEKDLINMKNIPLLVDKDSPNFNDIKNKVKDDFERVKSKEADVIIVLPHMGTQFSTNISDFQNLWNNLFVEFGADIILGDHAHIVQPIEVKQNKNGKDVFIVNCPGNFVNSYRENNGDATSMVEIYLDKKTGEFVGSSIIPMWVQANVEGNYRALPIYEIKNNSKLKKEISTYEMTQSEDVCKFITKVMIGEELGSDAIQEKVYYFKDGYKREKSKSIKLNPENRIIKEMNNSSSICFIGDSITEGSKNGGYPWYEPIVNNYNSKEIINVSKRGATVRTILDMYSLDKEEADMYIIAIGANDIRYRNKEICAMDENEYIEYIGKLVNTIPNKDTATIIFVAPWFSTDSDTELCKLNKDDKKVFYDKYTDKLKDYCKNNKYLFINPNNYIFDILEKEQENEYLVDFIHPNASKGIFLYSEAVLKSSN